MICLFSSPSSHCWTRASSYQFKKCVDKGFGQYSFMASQFVLKESVSDIFPLFPRTLFTPDKHSHYNNYNCINVKLLNYLII